MAWSDEERCLAVNNLQTGVDVYRLDEDRLNLVASFTIMGKCERLKQIDFALAGRGVVIGDEMGRVHLWHVANSKEIAILCSTNG